ncbi:MAG: sensor histidine kinase [Pleomorphochaeta sp.]
MSVVAFALLISLYYISFRTVINQILDRGNSDTNNIIGLIEEKDSIQEAVEYFNNNRDLEIIIVNNNYQVLYSTASTLRTQYFSNNITFAKSEGVAYSFIKKDVGRALSVIYSKRGNFNGEKIVLSIEYLFISYEEFKRLIFTLIILIVLIVIIDTYFITLIYINSYISDLNEFVKNKHIYNEFYEENEFSLLNDNSSSEVGKLLNTIKKFRKKYDAILENDSYRFSRINSLLANVPSGILIIDSDKEISLMNDMVNKLLKIDKRQIIHSKEIKNLKDIYEIWDYVSQERKIKVEDIKIRKQILEVEAIPLNDKYSPYKFIGVLFIIRDVTKLREVSDIKDEFVSNVSHEIRTPLTIISGFAQALTNKNISEEDKKICVDSIIYEVNKMTNLTNELLQISKIEQNDNNNNLELFNPFEIVKEQVSVFIAKDLKKNFKIHIELENNETCYLKTNLVYFRQIINNLIENAIKYSYDNTIITIQEKIENDLYIFSIRDKGIGIDENSLGRIFERFYRVEKSRNSEIAGSGLGLSIVKLFIEAIGGEINVESEEGVGSTFTIKIKKVNDE